MPVATVRSTHLSRSLAAVPACLELHRRTNQKQSLARMFARKQFEQSDWLIQVNSVLN